VGDILLLHLEGSRGQPVDRGVAEEEVGAVMATAEQARLARRVARATDLHQSDSSLIVAILLVFAWGVKEQECAMQAAAAWTFSRPKRRERHHSYNEDVDQPSKLIADEPVEIEEEIPADENEPVERIEENNESDPPIFEE
jgi:hypothetical protein